jgi:hypothetical protein
MPLSMIASGLFGSLAACIQKAGCNAETSKVRRSAFPVVQVYPCFAKRQRRCVRTCVSRFWSDSFLMCRIWMAFDRRRDLEKNASVGVSCKCIPNINEFSRLDEGIQKLLKTDDFEEPMQCVSQCKSGKLAGDWVVNRAPIPYAFFETPKFRFP